MGGGWEITSGGLVAAGPSLQKPPELTMFPAHLTTQESQYNVVEQVVRQLQEA